MTFQLNQEGLYKLVEKWGLHLDVDPRDPSNLHALEQLTHEVAHILDATGKTDPDDINWYLPNLKLAAQDYNEIRASAVTWQVMQSAGLLTSELASTIRGSLLGNTKCFFGDIVKRKLLQMLNSRRTRQQAKKIVEHYIQEGVLTRASS